MHTTYNTNDNYLGSGHLLIQAINKYGKENFTREILIFCDDTSTAFYNESVFINYYNTLTPNGYNISPLGGVKGKGSVNQITKERISKSLKGKKGKPSKYKGIPRTDEVKMKVSLATKGKKRSEETKLKIGLSKLNNKNRLGKIQSDETKKKISNTKKGKKIGPNKKKKVLSEEHKLHMRHPRTRLV